jgi:hypothetical protein
MATEESVMTPEIRRAALRAAAKAALVVSVGCSGGAKTAPPPENTTGSTGSAVAAAAPMSCADHLASLAKGAPESLPEGDPLRGKPGVYGEVYTDRAARESARTQECCTEEINNHGSQAQARWECCSALTAQTDKSTAACTPWGPPCPPAMA